MVLTDKYAGKPPPNLLKRTAIYVLSFGLGSLLLATILGFAATSVAEGLLPSDDKKAASDVTLTDIDGAGDRKATTPRPKRSLPSKARAPRANEAAD